MSSGVTVAVPDSDEEIDRRTYRDIFGERRWLIGIAAIVAIVLVGVAALALRSSGRPDAEPVSAVAIVEAEAGTSVSVTRSPVTPTQLQVARLGGAQRQVAQTVIVVDEAVLFEFDEAVLRPRAEAELDRILQVVRASGDEQVDVVGYTDAVSPQSYNLPLSRDRADAVATWLVEQGVNQRRLDVDWRGELDPVAPNTRADGEDHPEGRRLNRRVEIRIDGPAVVDPGSRPASGLGGAAAPSGATLAVDRVRAEPNAVLVDIRFVNPTAYPMSLNQQGIWLVDDLGTTYRFVPSPQNPAADVPAGSSMSGQLSFPGVVPSGASRVTLVTNADDPTSGEDAAGDVRDVLRSLAGGRGEDPAPTLVVRDVPLTR
jgi:outer membrane protein OmpA-like peptidoglycan-associated protein